MKTIAVKARRMPSLSGLVRVIDKFLTSNWVGVASISTAVCYSGALVDSDILMAGYFGKWR